MSVSATLVGIDAVVAGVFALLTVDAVRNRARPGAVRAGLLWLTLAVVAGVVGGGHATLVPARSVVYAIGLGWVVLVPLWAGFVFEYTGRGPSVTRRWLAFTVAYVAATGAATWVAGELTGLLGQFLQVTASLLQNVLLAVGLFGVFLLVRSAVSYDDLPDGQAVLLSVSGIGVSLLLFSVGTADPATLPVAVTGFLAVIAVGFAVGAIVYGFFDETPGVSALARRSVLEAMSDSLVVVDRAGRLVDANANAERTLGVTLAEDAGRPARAVLGRDLETIEGNSTTIPTPVGPRQFDVGRSVLTNTHGDRVGTAYILTDVTDERTRKQRLQVFNRVLRHNLRNDLDAIRGFAEALSDGTLDDPGTVAERIETTAADLADVGETVERADRLMTRNALDLQTVDLQMLAEDVATSVGDQYDFRWTVSTAGQPAIRTDRAILRTALFELVENAVEHGSTNSRSQAPEDAVEHSSTSHRTSSDDAVEHSSTSPRSQAPEDAVEHSSTSSRPEADDALEHSDQPEPTVEIAIERTDGTARIAVRDDGPGIPEREKAILVDGEETPLQHGTGVGLWVVSWAVTRLGGDRSFEETADDRNAVVLTVPDRVDHANGDGR